MTKGELMKHFEQMADDEQVNFALFDDNTYQWRLLNISLQYKNDPVDILGLVSTPIHEATLWDISQIPTVVRTAYK
jgi:hypothetical protein